jgi:hypothetical protein
MSTTPPQPNQDEKPLRIRRGRVESVDLYEIKDSELDLFRKGSPADLHLNFAIFLLSLAFSAIIALNTAKFSNDNMHIAVIVVAVVGILMGVYLLISWANNRTSLSTVCDRIKERIKETDVVIRSSSISQTETTTFKIHESTEPPEPSDPTAKS